jgi:hypothetical protein
MTDPLPRPSNKTFLIVATVIAVLFVVLVVWWSP